MKNLSLNYKIEFAFNEITIYKNGMIYFSTMTNRDQIPKGGIPLSNFDKIAEEEGGKWEIFINEPFSDERYERKKEGWVLIKRGRGFA